MNHIYIDDYDKCAEEIIQSAKKIKKKLPLRIKFKYGRLIRTFSKQLSKERSCINTSLCTNDLKKRLDIFHSYKEALFNLSFFHVSKKMGKYRNPSTAKFFNDTHELYEKLSIQYAKIEKQAAESLYESYKEPYDNVKSNNNDDKQ